MAPSAAAGTSRMDSGRMLISMLVPGAWPSRSMATGSPVSSRARPSASTVARSRLVVPMKSATNRVAGRS